MPTVVSGRSLTCVLATSPPTNPSSAAEDGPCHLLALAARPLDVRRGPMLEALRTPSPDLEDGGLIELGRVFGGGAPPYPG